VQKFEKLIEIFQCYDTNVLPPFDGSQCTCNSYNRYTSIPYNKDAVFPQ